MKGLCGTFNWNKKDDLMTSDGDIETNVPAFIESFGKDSNGKDCSQQRHGEKNPETEDPCIIFPHRQPRKVRKCIYRLIRDNFFFVSILISHQKGRKINGLDL